MSAIKIVAVPPGEAPQQVREARVGLVLPLALPQKRRSLGAGVLTGHKDAPSTLLVASDEAIFACGGLHG